MVSSKQQRMTKQWRRLNGALSRVVLVDEENRELGRALKSEVHHAATPLHRAFSLFLFDRRGRTLVQRRALAKRTWPGIWSNSCCGHPAPEPACNAKLSAECKLAGCRGPKRTRMRPDNSSVDPGL